MQIKVRPATLNDLGVLLDTPDLFDVQPIAEGLTSFLTAPHHLLIIAICAGECIGFASAAHHLRPDQPAEMYLDELGVIEEYRRQGVATRLLSCLTQAARARECASLWVLADPTPEALGFYTSLGWEREGEHIAMFTKALT